MPTNEYAICDRRTGEIMQMIYTHRSLEDVQRRFEDYVIKPVTDVALDDVIKYRFWTERP